MNNAPMKDSTSATQTVWGKTIAVEEVGGIPFKMYVERPRRIGDLFAYYERWGERPHIVQGERVLSFSELKSAVDVKSRQLVAEGVKQGDNVFIVGWNDPDWVINFWSCVLIGAVPVVANAWWSERELEDALNTLKPVLTLADKRGATKMPPNSRLGQWETDLDFGFFVIPEESDFGHDTLPKPNENDLAVIIFTSGTDGKPKAVALAHRSLLATLQMLLHISRRLPHQIDETAGEIILHTGPLFHIGGVGALLRGVVVGNTLVMPQGRFEPENVLALIEKQKISRWNAVPTMITRVLEHPDIQTRDLQSFRTLTLGGAPVHAELLEMVRKGFPNVEAKIATGYGLTENCGQATAASGADTIDRPGTCGRPLPCVEIKLVPHEGMPDGEIFVRSPSQMLGYLGGEISPIDSEGWLHTGDLGKVDADGYLWITGRCKDLIIRGGENIAPAAVERALLSIPVVSEAVVFGVPHPDLGEEVMAVVVTHGETTPEQLQAALRLSLASFAIPSKWSFRTEKLPVNQTGKIDKGAIKKEALADLGFQISDVGHSTPPKSEIPNPKSEMLSFQHITPPLRLFQGSDCLKFMGRELERLNSHRAVIVCGASMVRESGLIDLVRLAMGDRYAGIFSSVKAHSPEQSVIDAVQLLKDLNADAVVAIGGGSAIVTARAASILLAENGELGSLCTKVDNNGALRSRKLAAPKLPHLIIPTTPTTAMVKAGSAVLEAKTGERRALFDPKTRAQSIFIHPDFLRSAPPSLVLGSGLNSFAMAIEGLTSLSGDTLSDALLMHSVRLMQANLTTAALEGDEAARAELVLAAVLCGQGTDFTGLGLASAIGHAVGSHYHIDNGIANVIVLSHTLRFNKDVIKLGLSKVATAFGLTQQEDGLLLDNVIETIESLFAKLKIPKRLRDVGVLQDALPIIAAHVMGDWFLRGNPRPVSNVLEIQQVLEAAW